MHNISLILIYHSFKYKQKKYKKNKGNINHNNLIF